ncbi:VanW family protein [Anaeromicropila herbilytica]|uniref:Exported protein n=1 Tax=Anaeromicropila herbilytica TaxID=2785025 RepID=A0A7R7EI65_9FIRM|nr:VanW family protein [Anaeromicropila herbilytica]BCN29144.1 exported protein [Anaeromicropila herbilytica]
MKKKYIVILAAILIICLGTVGFGINALATVKDGQICKGVYIDSVNVGGMTASEAKEAVSNYVDNLKKKTVTVKVDDNEESITLGELGYEVKENDFIDKALEVGRSGNVIKRYKDIQDTKNNNLVYKLDYTLDENKVQDFVKNKLSKYNIPSKNAKLTRKNGKFIVSNHKVGRAVAVRDTMEKIQSVILDKWNKKDVEVKAIVNDAVPKYTKELLQRCNSLLGSFHTTYATSTSERAANLANGARLINGSIVYPNEVFSAYDHLNPFTTDNGYETAGAYSEGKVIDSVGGGVCQVSTTLYNAVLYSELEVVERSPHSMIVSYVTPSRDAAIAGTYKDFKFKNNTEVPIYIEAFTVGRTITFNIYGEETRDKGRRVEYESKVLKKIDPPKDEVTEDKTKPSTFKEVTQEAHIGYKAELYKIVYQDGKEVSREVINTSSYAAAPRYITVGTKEDKEKEKAEKEKAEKEKAEKEKAEKAKADGKEDTDTKKSDDADSSKDSTTKKDSTSKTGTTDKTSTADSSKTDSSTKSDSSKTQTNTKDTSGDN